MAHLFSLLSVASQVGTSGSKAFSSIHTVEPDAAWRCCRMRLCAAAGCCQLRDLEARLLEERKEKAALAGGGGGGGGLGLFDSLGVSQQTQERQPTLKPAAAAPDQCCCKVCCFNGSVWRREGCAGCAGCAGLITAL